MSDAVEKVLLPCPFCGSSDIDPEGVFFYDGGDKSKPINAPACNNCNATSGKTIADWNRRTPPPASQSAGDADGSLSVAYEDGYQRGLKEGRALSSAESVTESELMFSCGVRGASPVIAAFVSNIAEKYPHGLRITPPKKEASDE